MSRRKKNVLKTYQRRLETVGKSPHTVRAYILDLAAFSRWFEQTSGESLDLRAVDPRDIQEYRSYLLRRGLTPATINRRLIALKRFFAWARREGLIADDPFEVIEQVLVKEQKDTAPRWLDRREQLALLRAVRRGGSRRDLAIVQTLLGTGLRISELAALRVSDVELSERGGWLHVRAGKGNKARDIPLDNKTRQAISAYLEERQEDGSERLFLGQRGPLREPGINYLVAKYAYQARLEQCTSHTLRHTYGKNLVDGGVPLDQVATLLGHESLDTTRIYTRPSKSDLERAVRHAAGEV
jgi:site-specific recombinase XerD